MKNPLSRLGPSGKLPDDAVPVSQPSSPREWVSFRGADGAAVSLRVDGYEFPEITAASDLDSQWLNIAVTFEMPGTPASSFVDPCLQVNEALSLAAWLGSLAQAPEGGLPTPEITFLDFLEPLLAFGLREVFEDSVSLAFIAPDVETEPRIPELWPEPLECTIPKADLAEAAHHLLQQITSLPPRV